VQYLRPLSLISFAPQSKIFKNFMAQKKRISIYRRDLKPGNTNDNQQEFWLYSLSEYDSKGNITEQIIYDNNETIIERVVRKYDNKGLLVHEQFFVDNNEPSDEKTYERDENGLLTAEIKHYLDGSYDKTTYYYDSQNRIIKTVTADDEGEAEQEMINEYSGEFLVRSLTTDPDGDIIYLDEFIYNEAENTVEHKKTNNENGEESHILTHYNSSSHKISETFFDEDGDVISKVYYEEDEKGNVVKVWEDGDNNHVTEMKYDEKGNAVLQEEMDEDGNIISSVKREFDEDGNIIFSNVLIEGQGRRLPQHYEMRFDYTVEDENE